MFDEIVILVVAGARTGCIYGMMALSYYVIIRATHILNFAQGEWMMLAAVFGVTLIGFGLPVMAAVLFSVVAACAVSVASERLVIGPLQARGAPHDVLLVALIGIMIVVRYGTGVWFGRLESPLSSPVGSTPLVVNDFLVLSPQTILVVLATLVVFVLFELMMRYTSMGLSLRVTAIDPVGARLCGINPVRVRLAAFALGGLIAAVTGWLYAPLFAAGYLIGVLPGIKGFIALILGGLGSAWGGLVGGLILGLIEVGSAFYLSSVYAEAIGFGVLLLVLYVRPSGILSGERPR